MDKLGLSELSVQYSTDILAQLMADEFMLFINILNCHWNVTGPNFFSLHKLLDQHYEDRKQDIDDLAERIRVFGNKAPADLKEFIRKSSLESFDEAEKQVEMLKKISTGYADIIKRVRTILPEVTSNNDIGTANFLEDLLMRHEKAFWEIEAHIKL